MYVVSLNQVGITTPPGQILEKISLDPAEINSLIVLLQYDGISGWTEDQIKGHGTQAITLQMHPLIWRGCRVCAYFGLRCPDPANSNHPSAGTPASRRN
jgi:hypothetical protein